MSKLKTEELSVLQKQNRSLERSLNFRKDSCKELNRKYYNKKYKNYKLVILDIQSQRTRKEYSEYLELKKITENLITMSENCLHRYLTKEMFENVILYLDDYLDELYFLISDCEDELDFFINEMSVLMSNKKQFNNLSKYQ